MRFRDSLFAPVTAQTSLYLRNKCDMWCREQIRPSLQHVAWQAASCNSIVKLSSVDVITNDTSHQAVLVTSLTLNISCNNHSQRLAGNKAYLVFLSIDW